MKRFLLYLSKSDYSIYKHCPRNAQIGQLSLGLFVLLTGILAWCSGSYAVSNMFYDFDWETQQIKFNELGYTLAPIIGFFYAVMIIAIDREVVSAKNKLAIIPRLFLAVVIGVVVALPIELKLFEKRINKELVANYHVENESGLNDRENKIKDLKKKRLDLEQTVTEYQKQANIWSGQMQIETVGEKQKNRGIPTTGIPGKGPAYSEAARQYDYYKDLTQKAKANLDSFLSKEYYQELKRIEDEYGKQMLNQHFDLLSRYQTLVQLTKNDTTNATRDMSRGVTLLFILFEIIPSLIKLMTSKTEYDILLEARHRLNFKFIRSSVNEAMEELEDDVNQVIQEMDAKPPMVKRKPIQYLNDILLRLITDQ